VGRLTGNSDIVDEGGGGIEGGGQLVGACAQLSQDPRERVRRSRQVLRASRRRRRRRPFSLISQAAGVTVQLRARTSPTSPKQATGDVGGVTPTDRFTGNPDQEGRFPTGPATNASPSRERIVPGHPMQIGQLPSRIGQHHTQGYPSPA